MKRKNWVGFIFPLIIYHPVNADEQAPELEEIKVYAPAESYITQTAQTATRTPTNLMETPYSVGVISPTLLQDSLGNRLEDLASFISGVQQSSADSGFNTDLRIRGFTTAGNAYLDGVLDNQRFYVRDLALVERVEILKGHSSVLYGAGSPGGTVNYISKKPKSTHETHLSYQTGSYDFNRLVADSTGALNQDKTLLYRVIAAGQLANDFREHITNDRVTFAPSLHWQYSRDGELDFGAEYSYQDQPYRFDNVYTQGRVIYDKSYVDPRAHSGRHYWGIKTELNQKLVDNWALHFPITIFMSKGRIYCMDLMALPVRLH